jgi:hypothetical protein
MPDTPGAGPRGVPNTPRLAFDYAATRGDCPASGPKERADAILQEARRVMLPALAAERAALAGQPWPEGVERLPERLHNVSVMVSEGVVEPTHADLVGTLRAWFQARQPRDTGAAYRAMLLAVFGPDATVATLPDLETMGKVARWALTANAQGAARAFLAALAPVTLSTPPEVGAEGEWSAVVEAIRPYRNGGGAVVRLDCAGRFLTVFQSGAVPAGVVEGGSVVVSGTVARAEFCSYTRRNVLVMGNGTALAPA